jgi:hypothetical protein
MGVWLRGVVSNIKIIRIPYVLSYRTRNRIIFSLCGLYTTNASKFAKNWVQYASNRGTWSTSVINSAFLLPIVATPMSDTPIETAAHAWTRLSCACSIEQIYIQGRILLAMHHGTRDMCSMSSSFNVVRYLIAYRTRSNYPNDQKKLLISPFGVILLYPIISYILSRKKK